MSHNVPVPRFTKSAVSLLLCALMILTCLPLGELTTAHASAVDADAVGGPYGGRLVSDFREKYGEDVPGHMHISNQGDFLWQYFEQTKTARLIAYIGSQADVVVPFEIYGTGQPRERLYQYNGMSVLLQDNGGTDGERYRVDTTTSFRISDDINHTKFGPFDGGVQAQQGNKKIETVTFPLAFQALSTQRMFAEATNLRKVYNFPSIGGQAGDHMFYNCASLEEAPKIPEGTIDLEYAFAGCVSLEQAPDIPYGVTTMAGMFEGCTNLKKAPAVIPDSVICMVGTFKNCASLVKGPDGIPFSVGDMTECFMNCTSLEQPPALEEGIRIMDRAFYGCSSLERLPSEPNSVESDQHAFWGCTSAGTIFTVKYYDRNELLQETKVKIGDPTPDCVRPVRPGYIFDGWSPAVDTLVMSDVEYHAIWRAETDPVPKMFTVSYWANGKMIWSASALEGTRIPECPIIPYKPEHIFKGWTPETDDTVHQDQDFYAEWEEAVKHYTIRFWDRGTILYEQRVAYGKPTPDCPEPTRTGYRFDGWDPQPEPIVTGAADYVAKWVELPEGLKYTVKYLSEGEVIYEQEVFEGEPTPYCPIAPEREGWAFGGWSPEIAPTVTSSTEYHALWNPPSTSFTTRYLDRGILVYRQDTEEGLVTPPCPVELTRPGYVFVGWEPELEETVSRDMDYHAVWKEVVNFHTVSYYDRGQLVYQKAVEAGEPTPACPNLLERPGYVFSGWTPSVEPFVNEDMEYNAVWRLLQGHFLWTYDANDGTGNIIDSAQFDPDVPGNVSIVQPTRPGYVFLGWSQSSIATEPQFLPGQEVIADGSKMLYAVWIPGEYTLTYNGNGYTSGMIPSTETVSGDDTVTIRDGKLFEKEACEFLGWNTNPFATEPDPAYAPGTKMQLTHHTTLYAAWKQVEPYYTISYDGNGNTEGLPPMSQDVIKTHYAVVKDQGTLSKDGYTFVGWATNPDAMQSDDDFIPVSKSIKVEHDLKLYAVWEPLPGPKRYTLSYNGNGGIGSVPGASVVYEGADAIVGKPSYLKREGYRFTGWSEDPYATVPEDKYSPGNPVNMIRDIRLYAIWAATGVTLSYDGNGATNGFPPDPQRYEKGDGVTVQGPKLLTRPGYNFIGWSENPFAKEGDNLLQEGKTFPIAHDTTLYAIWKSDPYLSQYTVTFSGNGGQGTIPASQTVLPGTILTFPEAGDLARPGYAFIGWSGDPDAKPSHVLYSPGSQIRVTENHTFFAVWEPRQGGGTTVPTQQPTSKPSSDPTQNPTLQPTGNPSQNPTQQPTGNPTQRPTSTSTATQRPTNAPTQNPSVVPSSNPTQKPTSTSSARPTSTVTTKPSSSPSGWITIAPTQVPSQNPTQRPSTQPTGGIETETYSLTYAANGGTGAPPAQAALAGSNVQISYVRPEKENFTFLGWSEDKDAKNPDPAYAPGEVIALRASTQLYAVWGQYTLRYDYNYDGAPQGPVANGGMLEIAAGPSRDGWVFLGWSEDKNAKTGEDALTPGTRFLMVRNHTFYAVWGKKSDIDSGMHTVSYLWTFEGADGTQVAVPSGTKFPAANSYIPGTSIVLDQTYKSGSQITATVGTKNNTYRFSGWQLPSNIVLSGGRFTMPDSDVTITGVWKLTGTEDAVAAYTVRHVYYTNGVLDGQTEAVRSARYGDTIRISNVAVNQAFKGGIYKLASITPSKDLVLTAGGNNLIVLRYERTVIGGGTDTPSPSPSPSASASASDAPKPTSSETVIPDPTAPATSVPSPSPSISPSAKPTGNPQGGEGDPKVSMMPGGSASASASASASGTAKPTASATAPIGGITGTQKPSGSSGTGNKVSGTITNTAEADKGPYTTTPKGDKGPAAAKTNDTQNVTTWVIIVAAALAAAGAAIVLIRRKKASR